ncbi:MAG: LysM peptidoglycan-binding domain-containing protein [Clostridia bacterium]|nr:LysM peptidoglycan-binding domain-containing protein [Clostridia bacterium]
MFNLKKGLITLLFALPLSFAVSHAAHAASYTVTQGDSLYQIGNLFNTSVTAIKQANNLSSSTIYPGQVLNISSAVYTVKAGDTLYLIANKYGITLYDLRKANNIWSNSIYPGQKLTLPGVAATSTQTYTSTTSRSSDEARSVIPYTAQDLDLLARLITAEATDQPYSAMVSVGAVVVNRVQDSRFPSTIGGVIYQKSDGYYQFTPVMNGWINKPATQEAKNAAYAALHGSDPTSGALYYFDDSATNKWLWSKPLAARIGNMVFVY